MKFRISEDLRSKLSKMYLDFAGRLPKSKRRIISSLQKWREIQKRESDTVYKKSRAPKGTELVFVAFRLIELFNIEDINILKGNLKRLFPKIDEDSSFKEFIKISTDIGGKYYSCRVGTILRNKKELTPYLISYRNFRKIKELPSEVSEININLHKFLPSFFSITFDVNLTLNASKELLKIQSNYYLPKIIFGSLIPWRFPGDIIKRECAENVRLEYVLNYIYKLQNRVEECIQPFIKGNFMIKKLKGKICLPSIEIYGISNIPKEESLMKKWIHNTNNWWSSFGFDLIYNIYDNGNILFILPTNDIEEGTKSYRLIIRNRASEYYTKGKGINVNTEFLLDNITPCISINEFLKHTQKNVEELRKGIFNIIEVTKVARKLNECIKLNNIVNREFMYLERISLEFDQAKGLIKYDMKEFENFERINGYADDTNKNVREYMINYIKYRIDHLKKHINHVTNSFSKYLTFKNMEVSYNLQERLIFLTNMILFASLIGIIIVNLENIVGLIYSIKKFFNF